MNLQLQEYDLHVQMNPRGLLITLTLLLATAHLSDANLRRPRLELVQDGNVSLYFYNLDSLTVDGMKDAVSCAVRGGHMSLTKEGWKNVTGVTLEQNPNIEVWHMPKISGGHSKEIIQTRTTFNVIHDVEGNLTCHDTLGKNLVSNTILLQPINSASVLVKLRRNQPLPRIELILRDYVLHSSSTLKARLMAFKNGTNSEISLRVIYSNSSKFPDDKVVTHVSEWTESIATLWNFTVESVRSTRFCPSVDEGNFTWPMTAVGATTSPKNYCLDVDDIPAPKRKCVGDYFHGVYWDSSPGRPPLCLDPLERSTSLKILTNLYDRNNLLERLLDVISVGGNLSSVEFYFVSEALRQAAEEVNKKGAHLSSIKTESVGKIVNSVLQSGCKAVKSADESYGSSKLILEAVEKLLQAAASPMPIPITLSHFSAFASLPGTGIRGFNYSIIDGKGRMETFHKLQYGPSTVICMYKDDSRLGIIATYYNNGCLFSAANSVGRNSLGPVFGMKMFEKGSETLREQEPVLLTMTFTIEKKNKSLRCASWSPSVEGGWSTAGCNILRMENKSLECTCSLLKSVETFFTFIDSGEEWTGIGDRLAILPLKNNVGALLHLYTTKKRSQNIDEIEEKISCTAKIHETEESIHFTKIGEFKLTYVHIVIIYSLSFSSDGYVQCKFGGNLTSNECMLLVQNKAFVKIRAQNPVNIIGKLQKYAFEHNLKFDFTKMATEDDPDIEIFLVLQHFKNDHLKFMEGVKQAFNDMSALYNFNLIAVTSNRMCLKHEEDSFLWPNTMLHHHATPINPCLDENGVPTPTRLCMGDHLKGMFWEKAPERPRECNRPSNKSQILHDLVIFKDVKDMLQDVMDTFEKEEIDIVKFKTITDVLKIAAEETTHSTSKTNITSLVTIVNKLVSTKFESPEEGEKLQASSEKLLHAVDELLVKTSSDKPEPVSLPHFAAVAASSRSKMRGFVAMSEDSPHVVPIENVSWNDSMSSVLQKNFSVGAVLLDAPKDVGVTFSVFKNSSLFKAKKNSNLVLDSPVVGFNIFKDDRKGLIKSDNSTFMIFFVQGKAKSSKNRDCYFWDSKGKQWSKEGVAKVTSCNFNGEIPKDKDVCLSTHLTHFAMLLSTNTSYENTDLLHLLTLLGCSISLICLLGIFVMALSSPKWRRGTNKKVQLNLSASLTLMMACYLAIAAMGECPTSLASCIALGALMHYSVCAAFSWMVAVAILLLLKITSTDSNGNTGSNHVLKACILGWGLPMIPVAGTLAAGLDNYEHRLNSALCYPSGMAFYISVFFPIAVAVAINMIIFIWMMYILFCYKMNVIRARQKSQVIRRAFSAFFLFCLLGIAWISGIFVEITLESENVSNALSYVFCATATLQGACLFIFFVACDRKDSGKMKISTTSLISTKSVLTNQNIYITEFDCIGSDITTMTMEFSQSTLEEKKEPSVSFTSNQITLKETSLL